MDTTKICTKCGKDNKITKYIKNTRYKDGFTNVCKSCRSEYRKTYNAATKEARAKYAAQYYLENKEDYLDRGRRNKRDRLAKDPAYRMLCSMRTRMWHVLNGTRKYAPTLELLGCTRDEFRDYIEAQFTEGMTWDNYGLDGWTLDHKLPCSAFDHSNPEHQEVCWHHSNYQPLWSFENLRKSDTILPEHADKLPTNLL